MGYHGRPELTAERFVPDCFSSEPTARLYRTGDLGRWDSEGRLYCLGRIDRQVKTRGFRIEPGEIEAVLRSHEAVRNAAVVARHPGNRFGDLRLVAYLVYRAGEEFTMTEVKSYLTRRLPEVMIPSMVCPGLDSHDAEWQGRCQQHCWIRLRMAAAVPLISHRSRVEKLRLHRSGKEF
jgi:acyl-CoA synthetase (AMP-forming)/AMP-acid ligase II